MNGTERNVFPSVIGNEQLKTMLSSDFAEGKSAHAYIIEGQEGSGKRTLAREICASVLCENRNDQSSPLPCGHCSACKKVKGELSVDVLKVTNGDRATIGVDSIRLIKQNLYIPPNDGDKKIYIIENADTMTTQAQNALLLSLEEPPPYVMFLLLCTTDEPLLETIKSRAPTLRTEKFPPEVIEGYLRKKYPSKRYSDEDISYSARLSSGSIGRAEEILSAGSAETKKYSLASQLVRHLLTSRKSDALAFVSSSMPKDRGETKEILTLARFALRDIIADKKGSPLIFYALRDGEGDSAVPKGAKNMSQKKLVDLTERLSEAEERIGANLSQSTVLYSLVMNS